MGNTAQVDFVGSAQQLLAEYNKLQSKNQQLESDLKKVGKASKEANADQKQLAREAKKAIEETLTPLERYNERLSRLNDILRKGLISNEQFDRSMAKLQKDFYATTAATNAHAKSQDKLQTTQARTVSSTNQVTGGITGMVVGYGTATAAVYTFMRANQEAAAAADAAAEKWHAAQRKFSVQSGLGGLAKEEAQQRILKTATDRAIDVSQANDIATQMVSSGFSPEEASGESFNEFAMLLNAQAAAGETDDPAGAAKALSMYLQSQGMEKNAGNVRRVGRTAHALSKAGQFNMGTLMELANEGSNFKGVMSVEEQMAAMGTLADVMPGADAATGLRNVTGRMRTAGGSKDKVEALSQLGIKPEDIDLVGEGYNTAMERLGTGLQRVGPAERHQILTKIFEERGVGAASVLIDQQAKTRQLQGVGMSDEAFRDDVVQAESGADKGLIRQANRKLQRDRGRAQHDALTEGRLDETLDNAGLPPIVRDLANKGYRTLRYLGASPNIALQGVTGQGSEGASAVEGLAGRDQLSPLAGAQAAAAIEKSGWRQNKGATGGGDAVANLTAALNANTKTTEENTKQNGGWRQNKSRPPEAALGRSN